MGRGKRRWQLRAEARALRWEPGQVEGEQYIVPGARVVTLPGGVRAVLHCTYTDFHAWRGMLTIDYPSEEMVWYAPVVLYTLGRSEKVIAQSVVIETEQLAKQHLTRLVGVLRQLPPEKLAALPQRDNLLVGWQPPYHFAGVRLIPHPSGSGWGIANADARAVLYTRSDLEATLAAHDALALRVEPPPGWVD